MSELGDIAAAVTGLLSTLQSGGTDLFATVDIHQVADRKAAVAAISRQLKPAALVVYDGRSSRPRGEPVPSKPTIAVLLAVENLRGGGTALTGDGGQPGAFTVLSAGVFTSEKGKEAVYAGLDEVRGSLELRGSVIALGSGTVVTEVRIPVANSAAGAPIDLTTGANRKIVIDYRDEDQRISDISTWSASFKGANDGDDLLEQGEQAEITVPISGVVSTNLGINTTFAIEMKPLHGGTLVIERTTPGYIDSVMDLY